MKGVEDAFGRYWILKFLQLFRGHLHGSKTKTHLKKMVYCGSSTDLLYLETLHGTESKLGKKIRESNPFRCLSTMEYGL